MKTLFLHARRGLSTLFRRKFRRVKQRWFQFLRRSRMRKRKGVNILEIFETFRKVPDPGAMYTLKLCAALPVRGDAAASMNFSAVAMAGHAFLVLSKENGTARVSRSFGFYPARRLSVRSPLDSYPSIIRDNRLHVVHAHLKMAITAPDFEVIRTLATVGAGSGYRLLDFNCATFAVRLFNTVRTYPLILPPYGVHFWGIPIGYNRLPSRRQMIIPESPQGLYLAIKKLAAEGAPGAFVDRGD